MPKYIEWDRFPAWQRLQLVGRFLGGLVRIGPGGKEGGRASLAAALFALVQAGKKAKVGFAALDSVDTEGTHYQMVCKS